MFLEISWNSQENTCARVSFLIKLQAWGLSSRHLARRLGRRKIVTLKTCLQDVLKTSSKPTNVCWEGSNEYLTKIQFRLSVFWTRSRGIISLFPNNFFRREVILKECIIISYLLISSHQFWWCWNCKKYLNRKSPERYCTLCSSIFLR